MSEVVARETEQVRRCMRIAAEILNLRNLDYVKYVPIDKDTPKWCRESLQETFRYNGIQCEFDTPQMFTVWKE